MLVLYLLRSKYGVIAGLREDNNCNCRLQAELRLAIDQVIFGGKCLR